MQWAGFRLRAAAAFITSAVVFAAMVVIANGLALPEDLAPFQPSNSRELPAADDAEWPTTAGVERRGLGRTGTDEEPGAVVTATPVPDDEIVRADGPTVTVTASPAPPADARSGSTSRTAGGTDTVSGGSTSSSGGGSSSGGRSGSSSGGGGGTSSGGDSSSGGGSGTSSGGSSSGGGGNSTGGGPATGTPPGQIDPTPTPEPTPSEDPTESPSETGGSEVPAP